MSCIPCIIAVGSTEAEKRKRYQMMGLAASGVGVYYLKHSPVVAGLYALIALGYFATAKEYQG